MKTIEYFVNEASLNEFQLFGSSKSPMDRLRQIDAKRQAERAADEAKQKARASNKLPQKNVSSEAPPKISRDLARSNNSIRHNISDSVKFRTMSDFLLEFMKDFSSKSAPLHN